LVGVILQLLESEQAGAQHGGKLMTGTVLITGANKGLGLALAARFLQEGSLVFAGTRRMEGALEELVEHFPRTAKIVTLDVADMDSVCRAAQYVSEHVPGLDILINNAAIFPQEGRLPLEELDLTDRHLQKTVEVNAFGPLRVTQQFLPLLQRGRRKLIINVSSEAGSIADCGRKSEFAYCMSKAALNMQSKILENALGPKGFKVLAIHPGWMQTDMGGPNAEIHPDVAAVGILKLATRTWSPSDEIYLDYEGNPLRW
jgi:NAD(P)-dependent dehydrogenase (short-subunit alcohol dehydrogenase family)